MKTPIVSLDRIRQTIAPNSISAELAEIQSKLLALDQESAERMTAAHELFRLQSGALGHDEKTLLAHWARIERIKEERRPLRARRRTLTSLLVPPSPGQEATAGIAMPAELVLSKEKLVAARSRRRDLMMAGPGNTETSPARYLAALEQIEEEISRLRIERARHLAPYHAAVSAALQPVIHDAAKRLRAAAVDFIAATNDLADLSTKAPPAAPGLGNGLEYIAFISTKPAMDAMTFAETLLQSFEQEGVA